MLSCTLFEPDGSSLFTNLATNFPSTEPYTLAMVPSLQASSKPIAVCLSGAFEKWFLVAEMTSPDTFAHLGPVSRGIDLYALESNPLNMQCGEAFVLSFQPAPIESGGDTLLGYTMNTSNELVAVMVQPDEASSDVAGPVAKRQKRTLLKMVTLSGNRHLNREGSMRCLVAWLDKHNADLASHYGVDKLVWCEEVSSARSSGTIRSFFRYDLGDSNKRKPCVNASVAIEHMQAFTKSDFYDDMLQRSEQYTFDLSDILGNSKTSTALHVERM